MRRHGTTLRSAVACAAMVLVLAACQSWSQFGYGPGLTGFNAGETRLSTANVASLSLAWTASISTDASALKTQEPVIAGNVLYVSSWTSLAAYPTSPDTATCSVATPPSCPPSWTALLLGNMRGAPAVAGSVVVVATDGVRIEAFDRAGTTGCSGTPKVCQPLWTAVAGSIGSVTVDGSHLYVNDEITGRLLVFDAGGSLNCSGTPKVCQPLWSSSITGFGVSSPAVVNGRVYALAAGGGGLAVFDADGAQGCAGSPIVCAPLWQAPIGRVAEAAPVVANGSVYVVQSDDAARVDALLVFDAAGRTNCGGAPVTCSPLWSATLGVGSAFIYLANSPAVDGNRVYVPAHERLLAFSATGATNCTGTPRVCTPLWSATTTSHFEGVSVANGVVLTTDGLLRAYDAAGIDGCTGSPAVCAPLFTSSGGAVTDARPVIDSGRVFVTSDWSPALLRAFVLP